MTAVLEAQGVTRVLPGVLPVTLVREVSLAFEAGEFAAISGPSGSGKSSLLYLLGLLDRPSEGRIVLAGGDTAELDGSELARLRLERLGFVFQFHFLLPEFSAHENVLIPMRKLGRLGEAEMRARGAELLTRLGLGDKLDRRPDQLSGGERQRCAIARALANAPLIVLADEPTGNLDTANAERVFDIFSALAREEGKTVIAVTHDLDLAAHASRRIRIVDGRIVEDDRSGAKAHLHEN